MGATRVAMRGSSSSWCGFHVQLVGAGARPGPRPGQQVVAARGLPALRLAALPPLHGEHAQQEEGVDEQHGDDHQGRE